MRSYAVFLVLYTIKVVARLLWRVQLEWVRHNEDPWANLRVLVLLNHTSLYEPVFMAAVPNRFLWQLAVHGVMPVAEKTIARPIVGRFFKFLARHVVPVRRQRHATTRQRHASWSELLSNIQDPKSLVLIVPEGRMKRTSGLDRHGNPLIIRGGIADVLQAVPDGRLLIAYSGGLHHVQAPGERFPRLFKRAWLGAEVVDIPSYREELRAAMGLGTFKDAVIEDLTRRRDTHCDREGNPDSV
jgi:1-acyl-sn-glycerol-3-phosphate acyltransferase